MTIMFTYHQSPLCSLSLRRLALDWLFFVGVCSIYGEKWMPRGNLFFSFDGCIDAFSKAEAGEAQNTHTVIRIQRTSLSTPVLLMSGEIEHQTIAVEHA